MKIAYCGFDFFSACLEQLIEEGHEISAVFSASCEDNLPQNNRICELCKSHELTNYDKPVDENTLISLEQSGCELIISAAYDYKIPSLKKFKLRGINIHPTLLPIGRGIWPLPWTILTEQEQGGVTIHKLTQKLDSGDILMQRSFPVENNERLETLSAKVQMMAKGSILEVIDNFDQLWDTAVPQAENGSYWPNPQKKDRTINWGQPVREIEKLSRAFGKAGCYGRFENKNWIVYSLQGWRQQHNCEIGTVVHKTSTEMIVAALDGFVSLIYFEPDTQKRNQD